MSDRDPIGTRYFGCRGVMLAPVGHDPGRVPKGWGKWAVVLDGRIVGTIAADPQGFGWWAKVKGSEEPAEFVRGRERARDFVVARATEEPSFENDVLTIAKRHGIDEIQFGQRGRRR